MLPLSFPLLDLCLLGKDINFVKDFNDFIPALEKALLMYLVSHLRRLSKPIPQRSERLKVLLQALELVDLFPEIVRGSFSYWHRF